MTITYTYCYLFYPSLPIRINCSLLYFSIVFLTRSARPTMPRCPTFPAVFPHNDSRTFSPLLACKLTSVFHPVHQPRCVRTDCRHFTMSGIALKLTSLLVRTVAKPIATAIKAQAKEHEKFRQGCIRIAQTVHHTDIRLRMSLLGEKKIKIRPLNDKKAVENGANFLSEFFIFSVAGSLILYESFRSRKKAADERDALADDIATLQDEIEYIKKRLASYNVRMDDYKPPEGYRPKYVKIQTGDGDLAKTLVDTSQLKQPDKTDENQKQVKDQHSGILEVLQSRNEQKN